MSLARKKFTELKERSGRIPDAELDDFWASLQPASLEGIIGAWKGGEFRTGHKMNGQLEKAGWFGKTFKSASDVQPLVCLDADGNSSPTWRWARARPACGWKTSAAKSPPRWSMTANPCTTINASRGDRGFSRRGNL
jgi:hypothetical protein